MLSCEICNIFKNTFFTEHLFTVTASVYFENLGKILVQNNQQEQLANPIVADNNFTENITAETSTGSLMFWRNKDVKRVNSCMTHCSKKSESQTPSGFPENRCSYCLEKNPGEWNYGWIKFRAEDLHHTYCRHLFSNKFANVLVKYFLSMRSMEHYF